MSVFIALLRYTFAVALIFFVATSKNNDAPLAHIIVILTLIGTAGMLGADVARLQCWWVRRKS